MISVLLTKLIIFQDCNNVSPGGGGDRLVLLQVISLVLSYGVKSAIIFCLFLERREARKFTGIRTRCESTASLRHRGRCHLEEGHHPGRLVGHLRSLGLRPNPVGDGRHPSDSPLPQNILRPRASHHE